MLPVGVGEREMERPGRILYRTPSCRGMDSSKTNSMVAMSRIVQLRMPTLIKKMRNYKLYIYRDMLRSISIYRIIHC